MEHSVEENRTPETLNDTNEEEAKTVNPLVEVYRSHGFFGAIVFIIKNITIEPVVFFAMFCIIIAIIPTHYLIYEKVCRVELHHDKEMCKNILYNSSYHAEKEVLQSKSSNWIMITMAAGLIPDLLVKLLAGAWSDKYGRKPIIMFIFIGIIIKQIGLLLNIYYEMAGVGWIVAASLPSSFFSTSALFPISVSYISDITMKKNRTTRILLMQIGLFVGFLVGEISGGHIRDAFGFEAVYMTALICASIALLYTLFLVKETTGIRPEGLKGNAKAVKDFFDITHLKATFKILKVKRSKNTRLHVILLIVAALFDSMLVNCHRAVDVLYTQAMFDWKSSQYATATTVTAFIEGSLMGVAVFVLIGKLKLADMKVAIIGFISAAVGYGISAFSIYPWIYYIGKISSFMTFLPDIIIQSNLTKLVNPDEIGKVMTLKAAVVSLGGPETNIAFVALYKSTKSFFHGFSYLFTSVFYILPLSLFIIMHYKPSENLSDKEPEVKEVDEENLRNPEKIYGDGLLKEIDLTDAPKVTKF